MADEAYELQGLRLKAHDLGSGAFSFTTYDAGGANGVADLNLEVQGYRIKAHDNGDGTHSPVTTTSTGVGDVTVEWQGLRLKLHPTGDTVTIGGVVHNFYAIVVFPV